MTAPTGPTTFVDLHMHSTASDGSRSPADVVRAAKAAGLVAIALTDHDSVAGLNEAHATGVEIGVRIVNGVELSAVEGDSETHLLGLHLRDTQLLECALNGLRGMRERRKLVWRHLQRHVAHGMRLSGVRDLVPRRELLLRERDPHGILHRYR